ncbi:tetratricopeptide repeat protein 5 isoform X3 [Phaenicophaeus curvirostris]|uniref:tetratricopeptide repeat protein 5 isoform X3 n=1 Tax=Phaenicophaeus curvirostris TaxID=33595 RepID=UPI0037F0B18F
MAAPAEEAAAEPDEEALRRLEELVSELLRFRDGLPAPPAPGNGAGRDPLEEEMEKTLKLMEEVEVSPEARGRALVLRARALGVCEAGSRRAEEALSRAVKLEPALAAAWTRLGERRWHRGDLEGARACFAGALQHGEDAEARRLLSMVLRAGAAPGGSPGPLRQSLAQAEAAVRCDPRDGRSWYVLGNAYVALFFSTGQSPDLARRALAAYAQAERVDPEAAKNPDLHLNRATLLQYEERWAQALEGFAAAAALAPHWPEPQKRRQELLDFLGRLCQGLQAAPPGRSRPPPRPPRLRPALLAAARPQPPPGPRGARRVLPAAPGRRPRGPGAAGRGGLRRRRHRLQFGPELGGGRRRHRHCHRAPADSAPRPPPRPELLVPLDPGGVSPLAAAQRAPPPPRRPWRPRPWPSAPPPSPN